MKTTIAPRFWSLALVLIALPAYAQLLQPGWFADARTGCKVWNAFPSNTEQLAWNGECKDEYAEGKGVLQWILAGKPMVKKYEGEMHEGRMHGKGTLIFVNGDRYEGDFVEGERTGRGKITWFNRNTYEGSWKDGVPDGRGTYEWIGGNTYTGEWVKGRQHGKGIFKFLNGNSYEGEFRESVITGRGRYRWANGNVYEGEFKNEQPHGEGSYKVYNTGQVYFGTWESGCLKQGTDMIAVNQSEMACRLKR